MENGRELMSGKSPPSGEDYAKSLLKGDRYRTLLAAVGSAMAASCSCVQCFSLNQRPWANDLTSVE